MTSDINYRIDRLFRERRIEIPYPIQEFLLRTRDVSQLKDHLSAEEKPAEQDSWQARSAPRKLSPTGDKD